jgi:hypothetical protein
MKPICLILTFQVRELQFGIIPDKEIPTGEVSMAYMTVPGVSHTGFWVFCFVFSDTTV